MSSRRCKTTTGDGDDPARLPHKAIRLVGNHPAQSVMETQGQQLRTAGLANSDASAPDSRSGANRRHMAGGDGPARQANSQPKSVEGSFEAPTDLANEIVRELPRDIKSLFPRRTNVEPLRSALRTPREQTESRREQAGGSSKREAEDANDERSTR